MKRLYSLDDLDELTDIQTHLKCLNFLLREVQEYDQPRFESVDRWRLIAETQSILADLQQQKITDLALVVDRMIGENDQPDISLCETVACPAES